MQSFEIECCGKAQSRDDACLRTESLWDDTSSTPWKLRRRFSDVARERETQKQFENDLAETKMEDTQDLEMMDFIRLGNRDRDGAETLLFIANHIPNHIIRLERTQRQNTNFFSSAENFGADL